MLNISFLKLNNKSILLTLISAFLYVIFAYDLERSSILKLCLLYLALFIFFYKLIMLNKENIKFLLFISLLFRVLFIVATPNLSQDFYRFIWDGRMFLEGFNPYLYTPQSFVENAVFPIHQAQELYKGMGSLNASHFTNYPPIKQLCFAIAGLFTGKSIIGSVIVMRIILIVTDIGTFYFGKKLLEKLNFPAYHIFWFILSPFIIIELSGNLHFEGLMIFFLVWSLYLLHLGKWKWAAFVFALSISVKLIPLLFLPLFYQYFKEKKKLLFFYLIVGFTTLLLFIPFLNSTFFTNYSQTVALWFNNFEFNASLYYVLRQIAFLFRGWNEIAIIGKIIPVIVICFTISISFLRQNRTTKQLIMAMLFVLSFYYFMSTTVHPWYIAVVLLLSVFTTYKFPLVWSFVIILSYTAYSNETYSENYWFIAIEYIIIYSVLIVELNLNNKARLLRKNKS